MSLPRWICFDLFRPDGNIDGAFLERYVKNEKVFSGKWKKGEIKGGSLDPI
jgi:hypothetical protein